MMYKQSIACSSVLYKHIGVDKHNIPPLEVAGDIGTTRKADNFSTLFDRRLLAT